MLRTLCLAATLATASATYGTTKNRTHHVWPPPQSMTLSGAELPLHASFAVTHDSGSARLQAAVARRNAALRGAAGTHAYATGGLRSLELQVAGKDEFLGMRTQSAADLLGAVSLRRNSARETPSGSTVSTSIS